jgi:uncharacterized protein
MPRLFGLVLAAVLVLPASQAAAASFPCSAATAPDERAICTHRDLNDQDVRMALLYELDRHFLPMGGRGALEDEQATWLAHRHACGADLACLRESYADRIARLRAIIDQRVVTHGPF